ncbi:MAG TPA: response regulator transcription factor [Candidatus Didemnitutus sp.]|nr:response regulator transcription factor [Candidatus Didemnitutus sp.]
MTQSFQLLVVDDDVPIRRVIRIAAEATGYRVEEAGSVAEARVKAALIQPDIIILDLGLPDGSGMEVLESVRAWTAVPILILTAQADDAMIVRVLDAGADDYIVKPFSMPALLARMRVALRHHTSLETGESQRTIGPLTIDLAAHRVTKSGMEVHLTSTEYDLLALLVKHAGRVLTHSFILNAIWGSADEDPQIVRVFIRQLRAKIETEPAHPTLIRTEIGVGYRMEEG